MLARYGCALTVGAVPEQRQALPDGSMIAGVRYVVQIVALPQTEGGDDATLG